MNPRKILGVDDTATTDEISRAYREKSRKHHPDLGGDAWAFQQVQDAYESLIQPESTNPAPPHTPNKTENTSASNTRNATGTPPKHSTRSKTNPQKKSGATWRHLFFRQLPLQNETTNFILINVFDIFMTYILLRFEAMESNPIANFFLQMWGFNGMVAFKLFIVAFVCVTAQVVAVKKIRSARFLLIAGTILTGAVVVYSALLFTKHFT